MGYRVRVTSRSGSAWRIWGILKKSVSWVESCLGRRRLAFACSPKPGQWPLWQVPHVLGGGRWKSQNRKNVYLSPYVEEPLNSKVIKSFVPELRSRKCFSCFEIPMFKYIWYELYMYVSRISVPWLWYNYSASFSLVKGNLSEKKNKGRSHFFRTQEKKIKTLCARINIKI